MQRSTEDPYRFDFDLDRGIREQVIERLETSPLLPLEQQVGFFLIWEL